MGDKTLNSLGNDEVVLFADAVHPTHAARRVGCWAPKQDKLATPIQIRGPRHIAAARHIREPAWTPKLVEALQQWRLEEPPGGKARIVVKLSAQVSEATNALQHRNNTYRPHRAFGEKAPAQYLAPGQANETTVSRMS
jgi:hypothetical protein